MTASSASPPYRPSQSIPSELRDHSNIYFEEQLYARALTLLSNLLHSNNQTIAYEQPVPAYTPSERILVLLSTLSVHPKFTTSTNSTEKHDISNQSLRLLHDVHRAAGPVNANFRTAFSFSASTTTTTSDIRRRNRLQMIKEQENAESSDTSSKEGDDDLDLDLAHDKGLFRQAEDFWHVVGWTFNCACWQNRRWPRLKIWLSFMLDVLEDDWATRGKESEYDSGKSRGIQTPPESTEAPKSSILFDYITANGSRTDRNFLSRIIRAILADGGTKSKSEFGQIFERELAQPKITDDKATDIKKNLKRRVDLDNQNFGDYWNDDDESDEVMSSVKTEPDSSGMIDPFQIQAPGSQDARHPQPPLDFFGGSEAITLRKRFINLLIYASWALGDSFISMKDLLRLIAEFIYPLSLPLGMGLLAPPPFHSPGSRNASKPHILITAYSNLYVLVLRPLQSASGLPPSQFKVPEQSEIQKHYLRRTANDRSETQTSLSDEGSKSKAVIISDNAKVAVLLELLIRTLWKLQREFPRDTILRSGKGLLEAHGEGTEARSRKLEEVVGTEEEVEQMTVEATPQAKRRATRKSNDTCSVGRKRKLKPAEKDAMLSWEAAEERLSLIVNTVEGVGSDGE